MADRSQTKHSRCIAVCATNSKDSYSGGRYHSLMLAHALSFGGNNVFYITNALPIFWSDLTDFEDKTTLSLVITPDFKKDMPSRMDYVFIAPGADDSLFYTNTLDFARKNKAHICLLNFESGNWFNLFSPVKRAPSFWQPWKTVASASSLILSSAKEGVDYARQFYKDTPREALFSFCYPAINTACADHVGCFERERRILLFARFVNEEHKGVRMIPNLVSNDMKGFVLTILIGTGEISSDVKSRLEKKCSSCGVELDIRYKLSDTEKFKLYKKSKLLLFPSLFEGFGYPPIEARYCGCNVVAFDLPVLRETNGDDIFYAHYRDWSDFKEKIRQVIHSNKTPNRFRLDEIASLPNMGDKLNDILRNLDEKKPDHRRLSEGKPKLISKVYKLCVKHGEKYVLTLCKKIRDRVNTQGILAFYPPFHDARDLSSHFFRAAWYLPYSKTFLRKVYLYVKKDIQLSCPDYMTQPNSPPTHISLISFSFDYAIKLISSQVILLWSSNNCSPFWLRLFNSLGIQTVNVDTHDLESKEYGAYPGIIWRHLLPKIEKDKVINDSHQKLITAFEKERENDHSAAVVFGTGPSLTKAFDYDFSKCLTIACNSIIQNTDLMNHISPLFVTAGDAVSHYGVSKYAAKFREDLAYALETNPDLIYLGTATFGFILHLHYPHLKERILLVEQNEDGPNYDLVANYSAPKLDSTMNIHMLPLAATFHDTIFILGCDGKAAEEGNEDFWPHADGAQYRDLVITGHRCHPTFDQHRQVSTYPRHLKSVQQTVEIGEKEHKKCYVSLRESNIPAFKKRQLTEAWYKKNVQNLSSIHITDIQALIYSRQTIDPK